MKKRLSYRGYKNELFNAVYDRFLLTYWFDYSTAIDYWRQLIDS